jgi:pyruvate/2-oxoglutarate dehydrogenase complex dihydrolipoamide dehydrogenase (E3) component
VLSALTGDGSRSTAPRAAVPYTLFMTPPLARVGLTERDARRAREVKVVVDAADDTILGAALLSYDAHEVINTVALAIRGGITATELRDSIFTHPSMTEGFNQLLGAL